jgi:hypothetical protein
MAAMNFVLRVLLLVWVFGYLFVSCAPLLGANGLVGAIGFLSGIVLFFPWLVGVIVLAILVWLTNPGPRSR